MSSQTTQTTHPDDLLFYPGTYAKLNALRHKHNDLKKKYTSAVAHNEALQYSLDALKIDFKKIIAAYEDLSESDMARHVELETFKQECDVLKRQNNMCAKHDPAKDVQIAGLRSELKRVCARNVELHEMCVSWVRNLPNVESETASPASDESETASPPKDTKRNRTE